MNDDNAVLAIYDEQAAQEAAQAERAQAIQQEEAEVKEWSKRLMSAREFDKAARRQYAIDRRLPGSARWRPC
jgi:small-conductance mechanosensitive channel